MARKPKSAEISLGTLFAVKEGGKITKRIDVIIDTCQDDWFEAASIHKDEQGRKWWRIPGTGGPENYGKTVGRMSLEEVIEAGQVGARRGGYELGEELVNLLRTSASKGSRTLILG